MSTSLHIFSPDSSDGQPSESRFTQTAPSNKADASSMSKPFNFLAPDCGLHRALWDQLCQLHSVYLRMSRLRPVTGTGVSNESPDLMQECQCMMTATN